MYGDVSVIEDREVYLGHGMVRPRVLCNSRSYVSDTRKKVLDLYNREPIFLGFFVIVLYILVDYNVTLFVSQVMPVSTIFPDYKDTFTPCRPFPSREAAVSWLQMIGRENMFVLVTKHSDAGGIKRRGRVKLACERSGTYKGMSQRVGKGKAAKISKKSRNDEKARTQTGTKKCGCPFIINVKENADSLWYVTLICGRHNHDPAKNLDAIHLERLDKGSREVVVQMTKGNVKPKDILDTLKQRDVRNVSTMRTIYNARQKVRNEDAGGRTQIQQLREISRPSSTPGVVPPAKIKTKGRTSGSPIGGKAVSKRKHDDDDYSTRRLLRADLSPPTPQKRPPLLGERKARLFLKCVVPVDARKVHLTWLMVIA
ncbi:hypothetical protein Scep_028232 [Stephania cephalantha]|uniref:FAR1 domain-containing protein n=1 Tax=Stephania cephalantha TaxID=152367 RepID=A0AAP0EBQ8_9MAGN